MTVEKALSVQYTTIRTKVYQKKKKRPVLTLNQVLIK